MISGLVGSLGENHTPPPGQLLGYRDVVTERAYWARWADYLNQISELDAFAFGNGWNGEMQGWRVWVATW